jgi:hypothetical protein
MNVSVADERRDCIHITLGFDPRAPVSEENKMATQYHNSLMP